MKWINKIETFFYNIPTNLTRFKERLGWWFSIWKPSKKVYDFDYSSVLELEQHQLRRLHKSIKHYHNHLYAWHDLLWIERCINLLDIILGKDDWFDIDIGDIEFVPIESNPDLYEMKRSKRTTYTFKKYVNTNNYRRFLPTYPESCKKHETFIISVREEKAWNLYCRIRQNYLRNFWD